MEPVERRRGTVSQHEQWMLQDHVFHFYNVFAGIPRSAQTLMLELQRDKHLEYLTNGLRQLSSSFVALDANRPWLCYWILHSIALLGESVDHELEVNAVDFLSRCQDPNGGYGGGPQQMPHLATSYAAVNGLITLGGSKALSSINRSKLYDFLRRMKDPNGGFRMHENGEIDVRACYTAISVASILNILDDELVKDVGKYILSCQTYEGGIGGEPGSEAHGGYTFCGLAAMIIINEANRLDLPRLIDWAVFRQGVECGFQGRTNKLVDGCYSFWQGGMLALVQGIDLVNGVHKKFCDGKGDYGSDSAFEEGADGSSLEGDETSVSEKEGPQSSGLFDNDVAGHSDTGVKIDPLFHAIALQQYILICSQVRDGGFRDNPSKSRDYYHTCYCLSGLSLSQYILSKDEYSPPPLPRDVLGPYSNLLEHVHPLYNLVSRQYHEALEFFSKS